jgi:Iap family predicted aminopeptidase
MPTDLVRRIDMDYAKNVITTLRNMGTATTIEGRPFGFRGAGSKSAHEASFYVKDEMVRLGLTNVSLEELPLDAWEFRGAWVDVPNLGRIQAASFGGSPGTNGEITGDIVNVANGLKSDYESKDVQGKIVLVNWHKDHSVGRLAMEASVHGALAVVLTTYDSSYGMLDGALQCHDGLFRQSYPPVLSISGRDGLAIIDLLKQSGEEVEVTLRSEIEFTPKDEGGKGWNVVGYLPGEKWGREDDELLIIGDHTDAWFFGACDNNAGVAAVLVLADAFKRFHDEEGTRPRRTIVFIAHEAEEGGIIETHYTWLWGAWYAISHHHPDWVGRTAACLLVDTVGFGGQPLSLEMTPELSRFAHGILQSNAETLPNGYRICKTSVLTDLWPYAISGIASIVLTDWSEEYNRKYYHSQYDDIDIIDYDSLMGAFSVLADMASVLVDSPVLPLNLSCTGEQLRDSLRDESSIGVADLKSIDKRHELGLSSSLARLAESSEEFAECTRTLDEALKEELADAQLEESVNKTLIGIQVLLGRSLLAMTAGEESAFPCEQSAIDLRSLDKAITALSGMQCSPEDIETAIEALSHVGMTGLCREVSEATYRDAIEMMCGKDVASWGAKSHLMPIVDVWEERSRLCVIRESKTASMIDVEIIRTRLLNKALCAASSNLEESIEIMRKGLSDANIKIRSLIPLVQKGGGSIDGDGGYRCND